MIVTKENGTVYTSGLTLAVINFHKDNGFTIADAKTLSDFFLNLSVRLSETLRDCLVKRKYQMEKKMKKKSQKIVG